MSDIMTCMSFSTLLHWILEEKKKSGTVFGIHTPFTADSGQMLEIFGRKLETVIGPAAGPNSQLAQNIVAAYYAGSRFFELKTVQKMDGAELAACVNKPCIKADDECYNCEWSTELYVSEAQDEYIKAWFLLAVLAKEYGLGSMDGFQFNISVGYDLEGIKTAKIDTFIENMKDAGDTECFRECKNTLLANLNCFQNLTAEDVEQISPNICNSVTLSTLHGCPPQEIERIAEYLMTEKKLHTFIKCNPTLLGYDYARKILDEMGYDYVAFGRFHFEDDLQFEDAVLMLQRLMQLAAKQGLEFGVKLTNTFPVDVKAGELPSEEMYMSGKPLYALSMSAAKKLSQAFDGKLRIAYSGGADFFNIDRITDCGIWPVTMATTILKPGGYQRMLQISEKLKQNPVKRFAGVSTEKLEAAIALAKEDVHHRKTVKLPKSRKNNRRVPLVHCHLAPCEDTCPIHQDIAAYMKLAGEGRMEEAFQVILEKNALPFITGSICAHGCMGACTRNFYETPVQIRQTKLLAAEKGYAAGLNSLQVQSDCNKKVAIVGGGPAGMAAAYYLARAGAKVTIFEKRKALGGVVRYVIPNFRITPTIVDRDASFLERLGVQIQTDVEINDIGALRQQGFDDVILAIGASVPGSLKLMDGECVNALKFLEIFNSTDGGVVTGRNIVVIGGGNTAMDTARAAKRTMGVEHVYLVYRRTRRYMPADEEELQLALADGVEFCELLSPVKQTAGKLICHKMKLGEPDASGRPSVVVTEETVQIPADVVVAAVGEKIPRGYYVNQGIIMDERGCPRVNEETLETNLPGVYVIGDGLYGPSIVVKCMAESMKAAKAIIGKDVVLSVAADIQQTKKQDIYRKKGVLAEPSEKQPESSRCLECASVCENCVDVCPNRANVSIQVPGLFSSQVIHIDAMCNECGNCNSFCPYQGAPYRDKFTLFADLEAMKHSTNDGFVVQNPQTGESKVRYLGEEFVWSPDVPTRLLPELGRLIQTVCQEYGYLLGK